MGGIALELVNSIAVVSIAILFVPILKQYSLPIAYGYLATRIAEAAILTVGAFIPLVTMNMSGYYTAFHLAMLVLGVGSLFFCYLLYQSRLIPRPLSILGLVGYGAIAIYGFTELLGISIGMILFVPATARWRCKWFRWPAIGTTQALGSKRSTVGRGSTKGVSMEQNIVEKIQHETHIFSIAVSADEKLLAFGGATNEPIIVWDLSQGMVIARLIGLKHQAHSLAFSPDGTRLAAANLWAGVCVWNVEEGRLLEEKTETKSRKIRRLVYPETRPTARFPVMLSSSIFRSEIRALAPNGKLLAVSNGGVAIIKYRSATELARLEPNNYGLSQSGSSDITWAANSNLLTVSGEGWLGLWQPFEHEPRFFGVTLPFQERVDALGVLGQSRQVIYARGREVSRIRMPLEPLQPLMSKWEAFMLQVPEPQRDSGFKAKREWKWNISPSGHDGVHTYGACLLWYNETYPAHAGGWGEEQSFESFLRDGPAYPIPEGILIEVCQAVQALTAKMEM